MKRRPLHCALDAWRRPHGKTLVSTPEEHKASRFTEVHTLKETLRN